MSKSSPGSHTIALIPNVWSRPAARSAAATGRTPRALGDGLGRRDSQRPPLTPPIRLFLLLDSADDDTAAALTTRWPPDAADAGVVPHRQHRLQRMLAPEPLDAPRQETGRSRYQPGPPARRPRRREADARPRPPGRIPAAAGDGEVERGDRAARAQRHGPARAASRPDRPRSAAGRCGSARPPRRRPEAAARPRPRPARSARPARAAGDPAGGRASSMAALWSIPTTRQP